MGAVHEFLDKPRNPYEGAVHPDVISLLAADANHVFQASSLGGLGLQRPERLHNVQVGVSKNGF